MGRPPKDGSPPIQRDEREAARAGAFTPPPIPETEDQARACIEEHAGLALLEDVAALANVHAEDLKDGGRFCVIYQRASSWKNIRVGQAQYEKATAKSGSPIPGIAWMNNGLWKQKREETNGSDEIREIRLTVVDGAQGLLAGRPGRRRRKARSAPAEEKADAGSGVPEVGDPAPQEGPV